MSLDWKVVVLASVVFVTVGVLAYAGKVPGEIVGTLSGGILGWLVPSPLPKKETP